MQIEISLFAPKIKEQLKEFNVDEQTLSKWQNISDFILSCGFSKKGFTQKQMQKMVDVLADKIEWHIKKNEEVKNMTGREWLNSLPDEEFVNYLAKQKDGICISDTNKEYTKHCKEMDDNCRKCMLEFLKSNYPGNPNS